MEQQPIQQGTLRHPRRSLSGSNNGDAVACTGPVQSGACRHPYREAAGPACSHCRNLQLTCSDYALYAAADLPYTTFD